MAGLPAALPRPAAGCPFITKAHETLTRRPGESVVSSPRVRRRLNSSHIRTVSKWRFLSPRALRPRTQSELDGDDEALIVGRFAGDPGEAFQWGALRAASPHVPGPVDDVTNRVSGCPPVPVPLALSSACLSANLGAFNPRSYILTDSGDSFGGPPLTTSRGLRGTHKAFPDAGGDDWRNPVIQAVRAL